MSPEERESIINEAVERALLKLPDVWANLVIDHKAMSAATSKMYKDNPDFKGFETAVVSILADIDGKHPVLSYEEKLKMAIPEIKKRISQIKPLDIAINQNPDRSFDNGEL